jgi:hypothetical protein
LRIDDFPAVSFVTDPDVEQEAVVIYAPTPDQVIQPEIIFICLTEVRLNNWKMPLSA